MKTFNYILMVLVLPILILVALSLTTSSIAKAQRDPLPKSHLQRTVQLEKEVDLLKAKRVCCCKSPKELCK